MKGQEHDSLVVDTEEQRWYWNSQSQDGDVISWVQFLYPEFTFGQALDYLENVLKNPEFKPAEVKHIKKERVVTPPNPDLVVEYHNNLLESEFAQREWNKRGITAWHWNKWLLGFKPNHWGYGNALTIPFIEGEDVRTIRHRILKPVGKFRYLPETEGAGSWLFNGELLQNSPPYVVIVEGEIKCMVLSSFGEPVVGVTGINILPPQYLANLAKVPVVYVLPDPNINSKKVVSPYDIPWVKSLYKDVDLRVLVLPEKVDDWLLLDPNNFKYFQAAKVEAKRVMDSSFKVKPLDKFKK